MTLDNISERLNIYFNDYRNKDIIVNDIYNDVITYYMLDLLLGNIDNGKIIMSLWLVILMLKCLHILILE